MIVLTIFVDMHSVWNPTKPFSTAGTISVTSVIPGGLILNWQNLKRRATHTSVTHQRGTRSSSEALCSMTKVLDVGESSVSYHASCQRSSKRVHRGVRLHLDVSCWCKQNWDCTWRLAHRTYLPVFSSGRSHCRILPLTSTSCFSFGLPIDCFYRTQQAAAEADKPRSLEDSLVLEK